MSVASKNIRGLHTFNNLVASGGEDSAIKIYNLDSCKPMVTTVRVHLPN